ncbi:hypothetical protein [Herbidospora mongoliensis]|uniref:hypothetical protein n=1 Tax=Herbidospora mongoliensis TaxID=688067 RepID=UPI0008299986|nr:hypothetical protein [Herbidospora mongoliensis]
MVSRVMIALQTAVLFAAPVTAGILLTAPVGRTLHSASAYTMFTVAVLNVVVTVVLWRRGDGSSKPILYAALFLALTLAQIALGIAGWKTVHVPLGVLMFGLSLLQLSQIRTSEPVGQS